MTTALDIINGAFNLLGTYDPSEQLTAADSQLGLTVLNDLLDSWSNESLTCYATQETSWTLVPGKQVYTIGPSGDINAIRPLRIIDTPGSAYIQDVNGNNYPVRVVTRDQWNQIGNRSPSTVTSNFPDTLFYDPQFPLGRINLNPTPSASYTAFVDTYLQLTDFVTLASAVSLPPGYNRALKGNLAIELKPYVADGQLDEALIAAARESKASIKRNNQRKLVSAFDSAIVSRAGGSYNIYTDRAGSSGGSPS